MVQNRDGLVKTVVIGEHHYCAVMEMEVLLRAVLECCHEVTTLAERLSTLMAAPLNNVHSCSSFVLMYLLSHCLVHKCLGLDTVLGLLHE